ncbi:calcium-binding protein PBP1-like [Malus sylvestris]|uniref:calcium-binding protein PBP1-like n=1 Tax=Malus sylvestris TaxID=3752 RepID=UPI0021ACA5EB|nr:calcium-binding protein PBP1-like [Malus sylvestris]
MAFRNGVIVFEDFFPAMVEKLGAEGFMEELSKGFRLLTDVEKGVITFESLKKNSGLLGLQGMSDEDVMCMLKEGDLDGDGALDEMEFCTLMFRLSPAMMQSSQELLVEALKRSYPVHKAPALRRVWER